MPRSQSQYHYDHGQESELDSVHPHEPECPCYEESPPETYQSTKLPFLHSSPSLPKSFDNILGPGTMSIVESHAEGEACDVAIGGFESVRGRSMYGQLLNFRNEHVHRVKLLLNEPRGWNGKNAIFLLKPIAHDSERSLIMMKNDAYVPFSVSSIICATNVLAELPHAGGPVPRVPFHRYVFETGAGKVMAQANFTRTLDRRYRCDSVTVYCVPSFVLELGFVVQVPGLGAVKVDIAYGGVFCAFVDTESVGLRLQRDQGEELVRIGERIRRALANCGLEVFHPKDHAIRGITNIVFIEQVEEYGVRKIGLSATVMSPGRLVRSPSGTSTCAWLAIQHCRGEIASETFQSNSLLGTRFFGRVRGELRVGRYNAIYTSIQGRAWVTGFKQVALDPSDPFGMGFRGADQWGPGGGKGKEEAEEGKEEDIFGLGICFDSINLQEEMISDQDVTQTDYKSANDALGETF
ncbi:4-hydroxyproline 2-epimerase 1 [Penicillium frequentans]|nr:4-hydroxyproline 2-epimerase 1 [Penicillium glabrum]